MEYLICLQKSLEKTPHEKKAQHRSNQGFQKYQKIMTETEAGQAIKILDVQNDNKQDNWKQ